MTDSIVPWSYLYAENVMSDEIVDVHCRRIYFQHTGLTANFAVRFKIGPTIGRPSMIWPAIFALMYMRCRSNTISSTLL
ncbi:hypothetical protein BpHYR1_013222, partial [Brachionus plicatilis]